MLYLLNVGASTLCSERTKRQRERVPNSIHSSSTNLHTASESNDQARNTEATEFHIFYIDWLRSSNGKSLRHQETRQPQSFVCFPGTLRIISRRKIWKSLVNQVFEKERRMYITRFTSWSSQRAGSARANRKINPRKLSFSIATALWARCPKRSLVVVEVVYQSPRASYPGIWVSVSTRTMGMRASPLRSKSIADDLWQISTKGCRILSAANQFNRST
jgi:hypothetical protein